MEKLRSGFDQEPFISDDSLPRQRNSHLNSRPFYYWYFHCLIFFTILTLGIGPLKASSGDLIPGFDEANDSIRLRLVISQLQKVNDIELDLEQKEGFRKVIEFCREKEFVKGEAAGQFMLHNHFSFLSQRDSALAQKGLIIDEYLVHLSCRNQMNFWLVSAANLVELYQTDEALEEYVLALGLADSCGYSKINAYNGMAAVHTNLGEHGEAIRYFKLALAEIESDSISMAVVTNNLSQSFGNNDQPDSAITYAQKAVGLFTHPAFLVHLGNLVRENGEDERALRLYDEAELLIGNDASLMVYRQAIYGGRGRLALKQGNYSQAEKFGRDLLALAQQTQNVAHLQSAYSILLKSALPERGAWVDSLDKYMGRSRDEKVTEATVKYETRFETSQKEKRILELDSELKDEEIRSLWLQGYILFGGLLAGILILLLILWTRWRQGKSQREMERLRKQAIQLQMNPHFFFNSLNSIKLFIGRSEKDQARKYLVNFSKLMRLTLENSQEEAVPIEKEIDFLQNYLTLEQLRMKNFDFELEVEPGLEKQRIPSMLIQPLVENSLLHGFRGIDYRGILQVNIKSLADQIKVEVLDNGRGMGRALTTKEEQEKGHQSFATDILKKRIAGYARGASEVKYEKGIASEGNPGTKITFCFPRDM